MFKEKFKYFKRKYPPPDLTKALDFSDNACTNKTKLIFADSKPPCCDSILLDGLGLIPVDQWKVYELLSHPGLIFIVNPFTSEGQRLWIQRALEDYPKPPNKHNLHAHNELGIDEDWWHICQINAERRKQLYKRLRWVTLGYHHNWDSKIYSESERGEFPKDLKTLSNVVVKTVCSYDLDPQAAIVNYYNIGSTLSGHTDHSEPNREAPLVSFSFGQDAVFLIGGQSLDDYCEAILVRSGDIIVMSGVSRLCYHGVPLIQYTECRPWSSGCISPQWKPFEDYLSTSRINMNVRQVLHSGTLHL